MLVQDRLVREFENQREQLVHQHGLEKDEMITNFEVERENLKDEIEAVQKARDDQLVTAENEKQQVRVMSNLPVQYVA
jgi:hypothetical protein